MGRSLYARLQRKFGTPISGEEKHVQAEQLEEYIKHFTLPPVQTESLQLAKKVVIIGGGFAGMSAAYHLATHGIKVEILEARDHVGGRVHSLKSFARNQIIEAGAELIGANHPLWIKFARQFGFSFNVVTQDDMFTSARLHEPLYLGNRSIERKEANHLYKLMKLVIGPLTDLSENIDPRKPWESTNAVELDNTPLGAWLDKKVNEQSVSDSDKHLLSSLLEFEFANNNAVSTQYQSLLGALAVIKGGGRDKYWSTTEVYRCSHGNDALATKLMHEITEMGGSIHLSTPAKKIITDGHDRVVAVYDYNGVKYEADYLILAVPPSAWNKIEMDSEIIRDYSCQMGVAVKYLSCVDSRFWIKSGQAPSGMAESIGMTWEGSDNQIKRELDDVELTVFSGGDLASGILKLKEKEREQFMKDNLETVFPGYKNALIRTKFQAWPDEEWTQAGYSFPNVGEVCTKIKKLNYPYKNVLHFAGEHTCLAYVGYMEGALQSGLFAALRILSPKIDND